MEQPSRYPGFEIGEDMRQQHREWRMQRVAWVLLYALLLCIMLGLLGKGALSEATLGEPGAPLQTEYQRFLRHRSPDTLRLRITPTSGQVRVLLDSDYAGHVEIKRVAPEPERVIAGADAITFVFNARATEPMTVTFEIQPEEVGSLHGWVGLQGQERHAFSQFVYP